MTITADRLEREANAQTLLPLARAALRRLAAVAALIALLPVWVATSALVWSCVGRPIMFHQTRCGLGAEPFTLVKFRTLRDRRDEKGTLLPDAARQTPITRVMRLLRVDELPQLLAIARGEMAFVGPRPLLPATIADFGELGRLRCTVLPGLSGWAQVNGNTQLTNDEKLALDLWYVTNHSLALDCRILALTALVILRGERRNASRLTQAWAAMGGLAAARAAGERP